MSAAERHQAVRQDLLSALGGNGAAADLDPAILQHFPRLQAFREGDDLVLVNGTFRRLNIRRIEGTRFRASQNAAASASTNLLDFGGGAERDIDALVDEIIVFAGS